MAAIWPWWIYHNICGKDKDVLPTLSARVQMYFERFGVWEETELTTVINPSQTDEKKKHLSEYISDLSWRDLAWLEMHESDENIKKYIIKFKRNRACVEGISAWVRPNF